MSTSGSVSLTLSGDADSITAALSKASLRLDGPGIARSIGESREAGIPDAEILDVLIQRLFDGWY